MTTNHTTEPGGQVHSGAGSRHMWLGYLAVLTAAACWGTSGIFIKLISIDSGISATALAFWRDVATFAVFLTIAACHRTDRLKVRKADLPWLVCMGVALGLFHVAWNLGVVLNGAAVTTVQQAAMPAIVLVVARLLWRETMTWQKILAVILIFIGTVLVSGLTGGTTAGLSRAGLMVGFSVPITYAGWSLFGKKVRSGYSALVVLTYAFGIAALVLLPFQFAITHPWPVSLKSGLWFAGLIGLATAGAFFAFTFGLGRLPAGVASILVMTEIVFVTIYAYFLLGELMSAPAFGGTALVIGGVLLLFKRRAAAVVPTRPVQ